jgi:hypothetical protein
MHNGKISLTNESYKIRFLCTFIKKENRTSLGFELKFRVLFIIKKN